MGVSGGHSLPQSQPVEQPRPQKVNPLVLAQHKQMTSLTKPREQMTREEARQAFKELLWEQV